MRGVAVRVGVGGRGVAVGATRVGVAVAGAVVGAGMLGDGGLGAGTVLELAVGMLSVSVGVAVPPGIEVGTIDGVGEKAAGGKPGTKNGAGSIRAPSNAKPTWPKRNTSST